MTIAKVLRQGLHRTRGGSYSKFLRDCDVGKCFIGSDDLLPSLGGEATMLVSRIAPWASTYSRTENWHLPCTARELIPCLISVPCLLQSMPVESLYVFVLTDL